jgi:hypothetical protein
MSQLDYAAKKKTTKREVFLSEMSAVVPWDKLETEIAPHYPKMGPQGGRRLFALSTMLRIYCLQQWYNLSDPGAEEALYDIQSMCAFAGLDLGHDTIPEETTILNFRHLLERNDLTKAIFAAIAEHLAAKGERRQSLRLRVEEGSGEDGRRAVGRQGESASRQPAHAITARVQQEARLCPRQGRACVSRA